MSHGTAILDSSFAHDLASSHGRLDPAPELTLADEPLADVQAQTICHPPDPVRDRPLRRSARKNDPKAAGILPTAEVLT
jgi:hypothetical protein